MSLAISAPSSRAWLAGLVSHAALIVLTLLLAYLALRAPNFLDAQNLTAILRQSAPLAILACGLSVVVIGGGDDVVSGGIDLSLPAAAVLGAGIISYQLSVAGSGLGTALLFGLPAVLAVGAANSLLVVGIGLTPLLATLATSVAVSGLTKLITSNRRINVSNRAIDWVRDGDIGGIPASMLLALLVFAGLAFLVHRTRWGAHLQAIGASRAVASLTGLPTRKSVALSYGLAAAAAAVAAIAILARGSGSSPGSEEPLLLEMVLATFLGGAFSRRRIVTVWGALLGAVLVTALSTGFALLQVNIFWVSGIKGGLILLVLVAAALDERLRR
ncbi:ABC transporter permease [Kaistia terrae]|uniref:ABC transporter permease n=1 Tax=Kaistia terrae TaxID=537017 RepID=A0ABW0PT57_9HYPH|nr:ABC transporter permease [Kaistia terrae]MCX5577173.1 ABC transporter permease [Kaistia terrae]